MNEQFLKDTLAKTRAADEAANLASLRPDIDRTAALLQKRREARTQNMQFAACALAFALAAFCAFREWLEGAFGPVFRGILVGAAILTALTLALSPLMAYCLEEERKNEKA